MGYRESINRNAKLNVEERLIDYLHNRGGAALRALN